MMIGTGRLLTLMSCGVLKVGIVTVHECGPQSSWKHLNLVPCELRLGCWACERATTDQLMSFILLHDFAYRQ